MEKRWQTTSTRGPRYLVAVGLGLMITVLLSIGAKAADDSLALISVWRPSNGTWYLLCAMAPPVAQQLGAAGDDPVPSNYECCKGSTRREPDNLAVWRPGIGTFFVRQFNGITVSGRFGLFGDVPVPADYDGDGKSDYAVWRPTAGTGTWFIHAPYVGTRTERWGSPDGIPAPGDYDGDGSDDLGVWEPSDKTWSILYANGAREHWNFGIRGDIPRPADYDGDNRTDMAVFRPSNGTWSFLNSSTRFRTLTSRQWGFAGDVPVPADYDGDGRANVTIWRPSQATWYILNSSTNKPRTQTFGLPGDKPLAVGDQADRIGGRSGHDNSGLSLMLVVGRLQQRLSFLTARWCKRMGEL